jgi:hypothetical protein
MEKETENCSIRDACERVVPLWLVLLDNIPTAAMFLLGAVLAGMVWGPLAIFMMLYNLLAIVLFWRLICRHCPHLGTRACPCGYGAVAARYFRKIEGSDFRKIFRKNIAVMYPCWLVPLAAGVYLLRVQYSEKLLAIFAAFVVVAFVLIPAISRFVGCRGCNLRNQCPWMTSKPSVGSSASLRQ